MLKYPTLGISTPAIDLYLAIYVYYRFTLHVFLPVFIKQVVFLKVKTIEISTFALGYNPSQECNHTRTD